MLAGQILALLSGSSPSSVHDLGFISGLPGASGGGAAVCLSQRLKPRGDRACFKVHTVTVALFAFYLGISP